MRPLLYIIIPAFFWTVCGCGRKAFPDEKFIFSTKYRNLVRPYRVGDTLLFRNRAGNSEIFLITGIDSTMANTIGGFMNEKPYKAITLTYSQILSKQRTGNVIGKDADSNISKASFILLVIDPETQDEGCTIYFKNFRGVIQTGKDSIFSRALVAVI